MDQNALQFSRWFARVLQPILDFIRILFKELGVSKSDCPESLDLNWLANRLLRSLSPRPRKAPQMKNIPLDPYAS